MGDVSYSTSMETWETKSFRQIVANDLALSFNLLLQNLVHNVSSQKSWNQWNHGNQNNKSTFHPTFEYILKKDYHPQYMLMLSNLVIKR